jgi:hypothetical protein
LGGNKGGGKGISGQGVGNGQTSVREIAREAAREALKQLKDEERLRIKKARFHNTKILLENYLNLVEHYQTTKEAASNIFDLEDLDADEVIIYAIKRSRLRTAVMVNHMDAKLALLKAEMEERGKEKKGEEKKFQVIEILYLDPARRNLPWGQRVEAAALEIPCSPDSVRRWRNEMIRELGAKIFGVDGLQQLELWGIL